MKGGALSVDTGARRRAVRGVKQEGLRRYDHERLIIERIGSEGLESTDRDRVSFPKAKQKGETEKISGASAGRKKMILYPLPHQKTIKKGRTKKKETD